MSDHQIIGGAYLRIRPDLTGFNREVKEHVAESMRDVRKDVARLAIGAFAIGGIGEFISETSRAASAVQAAQSQIRTTLKNTGVVGVEAQQAVIEQIDKLAAKSGIAVPELAKGFVRLQGQTQNVSQAMNDLNLATDVARSRHIQLGQAALAIARYEGGSATSLSRLGFILDKTTTQQKARQAQLVRDQRALADFTRSQELTTASGVKLDHTQRLQVVTEKEALTATVAHDKAMLAQAKSADTLAGRQAGLDELQRRVAGSAVSYGNTAAGAQAKFRVAVEELQVSMSSTLLPTVTSVFNTLTAYTEELAHSERFHKDLQEAVSAGSRVVSGFGDALKTVGPPLLQVADDASKLASVIGGGPIVAGILVYQALGATVGRVAAAHGENVVAARSEAIAEAQLAAANAELAVSYEAITATATEAAADRKSVV